MNPYHVLEAAGILVEATAPAGEIQPILDTRKSSARGAGPDPVSSSLPPARPPVAPAQ